MSSVPGIWSGLNEYRDLKNVMMIGAFNQETPYYSLIEKVGIVDHSASLKLYQLLMRLACREWDFRGTINLYIPCLKLFEPIRHLFNEKMISYIPMGLEFEEAEDRRFSEVKPDGEWYVVNVKEMNKCRFPFQGTKDRYVKWFAGFGYQSTTIEEKYRSSNHQNKIRKHVIVYKSEEGLESAKAFYS